MRQMVLLAPVLLLCCEGTVSSSEVDERATATSALGERAKIASQHSGLCLAAASVDGAPVTQEDCSAAGEIEERVVGPGLVELRLGGGLRCIEMPGNSRADLTQAVSWPCWGGPNQRFQVTELGNGVRTYRNQNSGKCLDILGWATSGGAALAQYTCHGGANQQFKQRAATVTTTPTPASADLRPGHSGLCIRAAAVAQGQPLFQGACTPSFAIDAQPVEGAVELRPAGSSLCIEVPGSSTQNLTQTVLWPCWGGGNQRWVATSASDGSTSYRNVNSGKCLDVLGASSSTGAQLVQYDCHAGANQRFALGRASTQQLGPPVPPVVQPQQTVNTVQTVLDDMQQPERATARPNSKASVLFSGNFAQTQQLAPGAAQAINNITSWFWIFQVPGNTATNVGVEVRGQQAFVLRSNGQWVKVNGGRSSGWRGDLHAATYELEDQVIIDANTIRVHPGRAPRPDLVTQELWTAQNETFSWFSEARAVFATGEARLVPLNAAGEAELATARYAAQIGFDLWRRPLPFQPGVSVFDGSVGRMKPITAQWQAFNVISVKPNDPSFSTLPGYLGVPAWSVVNPYLDPPYTLSEAEVRANPPPLN